MCFLKSGYSHLGAPAEQAVAQRCRDIIAIRSSQDQNISTLPVILLAFSQPFRQWLERFFCRHDLKFPDPWIRPTIDIHCLFLCPASDDSFQDFGNLPQASLTKGIQINMDFYIQSRC